MDHVIGVMMLKIELYITGINNVLKCILLCVLYCGALGRFLYP